MAVKAELATVTKFGQKVFYTPSGLGIYSRYVARCHLCKTLVEVGRPSAYDNKPILCNKCKAEIKRHTDNEPTTDREINRNKLVNQEIRFINGVTRLEKTLGDKKFKEYEKAVHIAHQRMERYGSIDEVVAALVLIKCGHKIVPQQKVGKYTVDFALPEEKIIIEIDGSLYHNDWEKERYRDEYITRSLGMDWKIIHIPTKMLKKHPEVLNKYVINPKKS